MVSVPLGSLLEGLVSQLEQSYTVNVTNGKVLHTWESRTEVLVQMWCGENREVPSEETKRPKQ